MLKKLGLAITFVGFSLSANCFTLDGNYTDITTRPEFRSAFVKVAQFKTTAKKPLLIKYFQSTNELFDIVSKLDQENLTVVRSTVRNADTNKKEDHVYRGNRDTRTELFFENLLRFLKLYPELAYTGTPLVDEYRQGLPMKWVLKDLNDLHTTIAYLTKQFAANSIENNNKPLLLIEFTESPQAYENFTEEDIAFLTNYYSVLNPFDQNVKEFYKELQSRIDTAREDTASAKNIKESYGEEIYRLTEEFCGGTVRAQDLIIKGALVGLGYKIVTKVADKIFVEKPVKKIAG